jgi:hypothetical protein
MLGEDSRNGYGNNYMTKLFRLDRNPVTIIPGVLLLWALSSCSVLNLRIESTIKVEGGTIPEFALSGSAILGTLVIYSDEVQRNTHSDRDFAVWEIRPIGGFLEGKRMDEINKITFGVVPSGYSQIYPESGAKPAELKAGVKYKYWFMLANNPEEKGYFQIRDGKVEIVK